MMMHVFAVSIMGGTGLSFSVKVLEEDQVNFDVIVDGSQKFY